MISEAQATALGRAVALSAGALTGIAPSELLSAYRGDGVENEELIAGLLGLCIALLIRLNLANDGDMRSLAELESIARQYRPSDRA